MLGAVAEGLVLVFITLSVHLTTITSDRFKFTHVEHFAEL